MVRARAWVCAVVVIGCENGAESGSPPADPAGAGASTAGTGSGDGPRGGAAGTSHGVAGASTLGGAAGASAGSAGTPGPGPLCSSTGHTVHEEELDAGVLETGWTGGTPDETASCDLLWGAIHAFGDGEVCPGTESNPCGADGCCVDWQLAAGNGWGCGLALEVNNLGPGVEHKLPFPTMFEGVRLVIEGDVPPDGYWVGFTQAPSVEFTSFEPARTAPGYRVPGPGEYDVFLPARGGEGECTASCEGGSTVCASPASEPYDIVVYARGGASAASGRFCLKSVKMVGVETWGCE